MGKRLVHVAGSAIFSGHLSPIINNYTDILVIVHQFGGGGLGSVDEINLYVYMVSNQILVPET